MRTRPEIGALRVPADEVRSDQRVGICPGLPPERHPTSIERVGSGHGTRHRKTWLRVSRTIKVTVRSGTQSPMP